MKKNLLHSLAFISFPLLAFSAGMAKADTRILQSEVLAGRMTGYDGKAIQINVFFDKPLMPEGSLQLTINDEPALVVRNDSSAAIVRFSTRLRLKQGEIILVTRKNEGGAVEKSFTPKVEKDFDLTGIRDEFNPQVKRTISSPQLSSAYETSEGSCIILFGGVSNTGSSRPSRATISTEAGLIYVKITERVSTNPFFIIAKGDSFKRCDGVIE